MNNRKTIDYTRTAFEPGKIYAASQNYGLAGEYDRHFLDADLRAVEIVGRDGDTLDVIVHDNCHPSVSTCNTISVQVVVHRDVDGVEYFTVAYIPFFPVVEVNRGYMESCETKFFDYCREWRAKYGA